MSDRGRSRGRLGADPAETAAGLAARPARLATDAAAIAALTRVCADLQLRVAALEAARAGGRRRPDPEADDRLLLTLARVVGSRVFAAGDLLAHAAIDEGLAAVIGRVSVTAIGLRLRSLARRPPGDVRLERVGRDERGGLWTIRVAG